MRFCLFYLVFIGSMGVLNAQVIMSSDKKAIKLFEQGKALQAERHFNNAISKYNEAIRRDSSFAEAYRQAAACYMALINHSQALVYYKELVKRYADAPRYMGAHLRLAEATFSEGNYREALSHAEKYLALKTTRDQYFKIAEKIINNSRFALARIEHPLNFNPRPLQYPLNQFEQQYFPVLSADQKSLFFIKREKDEEIYTATRLENDTWSVPVPIDSAITSEYNEGTCTVSADGRIMVFTSCMRTDGFGSCDLYITHKTGDRWSPPKNMGRPINTSAWDSQPALSADGRTLYFVSDKKGGLGMRDIWLTHYTPEMGWSTPKNLGPAINSKQDDISPFIHVNGNTLYFATNSRLGFGGFDIYYADRDSAGNWQEPLNFGYPINTHDDELAMFITADGTSGYYSHETRIDNHVVSKLYQIDIPREISLKHKSTYVSGIIYDSLSEKPLAADIRLYKLTTGKLNGQVTSDSVTGNYLMVLTEGAQYALYIDAENYLFRSYHFDLEEESIGRTGVVANIGLLPIKKGEKTTLNSVLFEFDSYALSEKSKKALYFVANYLKNHPNLSIEIAGHTDDQGNEEHNLELSKNRAIAVYHFMIDNGVDAGRLTTHGYGSSRPVASNKSDFGRTKNRRIELVIID
jgi:outer membrane protein OmpA-like peptidoglycan-associated protein